MTDLLTVRDISPNGALVDSEAPLPVASIHSVRVGWGDEVAEITVRVRHVTSLADQPEKTAYRIGLEFLDLRPELQRQAERLASASVQPRRSEESDV
jgi:PilZ domain